MQYIPRGVKEQAKLWQAIENLKPLLGDDVVRLKYDVEDDWSGKPALFFKVVLSDEASRRDRLHPSARRVSDLLDDRLDPIHEWELFSYYSFRSKSEHDEIKDPNWA